MHATTLAEFFTFGANPRMVISLQLVFMREQNTNIWPAIPCIVNDVDLLVKMQNEAGLNPLQTEATPHLRFSVDDYFEEIPDGDQHAAVEVAGALRSLLGNAVDLIRGCFASKYKIEVFRSGNDEVFFRDGIRKLIQQFKEIRRNENSGAISGLLNTALDKASSDSERRKLEGSSTDNYQIVQGHSPEDLAKKVNALMTAFWVPQGGLVGVPEFDPGDGMSKPLFYQAMVRSNEWTNRSV